MKTKDITHRTIMLGEVTSEHTSYELAFAAAKKLSKENGNITVAVEGWSTEAVVSGSKVRELN